MKFSGLILMCASSCLALILPALGIVQFPKIQIQKYGSVAEATAISPLGTNVTFLVPNNSIPASTVGAGQNWQPSGFQQNTQANAVLPTGQYVSNPFPSSNPGFVAPGSVAPRSVANGGTSVGFMQGINPFNPGLPNGVETRQNRAPPMGLEAQTASPAELPGFAISRFGLGIWLLLGPGCLIGLALWTFSPNPSGTGRRTTK